MILEGIHIKHCIILKIRPEQDFQHHLNSCHRKPGQDAEALQLQNQALQLPFPGFRRSPHGL